MHNQVAPLKNIYPQSLSVAAREERKIKELLIVKGTSLFSRISQTLISRCSLKLLIKGQLRVLQLTAHERNILYVMVKLIHLYTVGLYVPWKYHVGMIEEYSWTTLIHSTIFSGKMCGQEYYFKIGGVTTK